ncbi:putative ABC transport system ATP-binding protein [Actinoplanes tereljensis]|uniref:ABC transporter permease n=1 Tax=Paractinoplanes tereljensis TaxID=571912 RepID=A0A919NKR5_9ACTN|nr:ABC transporter ATP-binding protein [Actinoplanes tereljensis]GIF20574.1 ABC transporter permease [Actinoplanes tereljensis]
MSSNAKPGTAILRRAVARNGKRLWLGTVLAGIYQISAALIPVLIGVIIDRAVETGSVTALLTWIAVLVGLFGVLAVSYRFSARNLQRAIAEEGHRLRVEVAAKILHPRLVRTDRPAGDLLTISTTDADYTSYVLDHLPRVISAALAVVVSAVTLLVISAPLGVIVLVATPIMLVTLNLAAPLIANRIRLQQDQAGRTTALATDLVTGLRPLRGIGAQDAAAERYRVVSREALAATLSAARAQNAFQGASTMLSTLLAGGIAIAAGWFALTDRITVGQFIMVIGSAQFLIEPFGTLAIVPRWYAAARASADRVASVLNAGLILPEGTADPATSELRLRGVKHGPLAGLDLHVRPGEFVGVVAYRPAEAEALVRLLTVPDAYEGDLLLGGQRLEEVDRARRLMHVEPHQTDLFTGSLASNVDVHGTGVEFAEVIRAAAADEVGLDTPIAERGSNLSGGQRQRVALARALFARSPLLVLHDPTTAVDAVTEHAIAGGIRGLREGHSTIVITSSPALLAAADRVVVIEDGTVVAEGAHADLSARDDTYRQAILR